MAEVTATPQPPKVEVQKTPETSQNQPMMEKPKSIGQTEQNIANRITKDGDPDIVLQDIERTPKFIRNFSKEQSTQERRQTARDIRATRKEHFEQKKEVTGQQTQIQVEVSKKESTITEQRQRLETLRDEIDRLSGPWFSRLLNYTKLRGLNVDLQTVEEAYQKLQQEETTLRAQGQGVGKEADKLKDAPKLEEGRQKLQSFYNKEKAKWATAEYTKEDIAQYFTEQNLSSLSIEDYTLLLKRFPSEMVTHVTRQGIVDKNTEYVAGMKEYNDGFMAILKDGRLKSGIGALIQNGLKKGTIYEQMITGARSKEEAIENLNEMLDPNAQVEGRGTYGEFGSLHFAAEQVVDSDYGAERGNEVFFVFPSALIASNLYYRCNLVEAGGGIHNDVWVWTEDQKGIDINAGVVFIPADARVDSKTGSRYQLDKEGRPYVNQEYVVQMRKVAEMEGIDHFAEEIRTQVGVLQYKEKLQQRLGEFREQLVRTFGITDSRLLDTLTNPTVLMGLNNNKNSEQKGFKDALGKPISIDDYSKTVLNAKGILYSEAENTISSREFWESYMDKDSNKKPSKIVYYHGEDPTAALIKWRQEQNLIIKTSEPDFGFPEKRQDVRQLNPVVLTGAERFRSIMEDAIEDHFSNQPKAV